MVIRSEHLKQPRRGVCKAQKTEYEHQVKLTAHIAKFRSQCNWMTNLTVNISVICTISGLVAKFFFFMHTLLQARIEALPSHTL